MEEVKKTLNLWHKISKIQKQKKVLKMLTISISGICKYDAPNWQAVSFVILILILLIAKSNSALNST